VYLLTHTQTYTEGARVTTGVHQAEGDGGRTAFHVGWRLSCIVLESGLAVSLTDNRGGGQRVNNRHHVMRWDLPVLR
jgi:hypothetical protein